MQFSEPYPGVKRCLSLSLKPDLQRIISVKQTRNTNDQSQETRVLPFCLHTPKPLTRTLILVRNNTASHSKVVLVKRDAPHKRKEPLIFHRHN